MSDALANGQEAARPDRRRSVHARVRRPGSRRPLPRPGRRHDPDARRLHARLAHQINVDNGTKFTLLTGFQQTECCSSSFARSFCAGTRVRGGSPNGRCTLRTNPTMSCECGGWQAETISKK